MITCNSCNAPIFWVKTVNGKMQPLDLEPDPNGNIELKDGVAHVIPKDDLFPPERRYMCHHATCPQGRQWRKKDNDVRAG